MQKTALNVTVIQYCTNIWNDMYCRWFDSTCMW